MFIFTRYVVWEVLKNFLLTLTALTLIVTIGMGVKEGASKGLPPLVVLQVAPYMLPEMLVITIPVSLLLAVSIVYGRMTGSNEIVAIKSLGISPMDMLWPTIVLALLLSIGTLYLQEISATKGKLGAMRVVAQSAVDIAYGMLQKNTSCKIDQLFSISVLRVEGKTLVKPTITIFNRGSKPTVTIRGSKAELETDPVAKTIKIRCWDGSIDYQPIGGVAFSGMEEQTIPYIEPKRNEFHRDWVAMHEIPDKIGQLKRFISDIENKRKALADENLPLPPEDEKMLKDYWRLTFRLQTEPYRRLSNGFTCLCFVLIGAPVAMLWRHADVLTNFFVCFLPILAVYYPLLMIGDDLSTSGKLWPISFWIGNVVLIIPGFFLMKWVIRH